ncbi:MAG: FkbM family methyltransferase [Planctomycetales bacterium]|nr:FkbM family methyltransferase [Planctomycetales bacterium]
MEQVEINSRAGEALGLVLDPTEYIQNVWRTGHFFEERLLEYIYWHYKGRVFIDVGSCIGNHTLFFAKFCQPKHVVSIEPHPASAEHQRQLLKLNGVQRAVTLHQVAVSDRAGRGRLRPWDARHPFASNELLDGDEVDVTTLDELLPDMKHVNLVKIDVEGHELKVLDGAREFLKRNRPSLFVEFRKRANYHRATEWLAGYGYRQSGSVFQDATVFEFVP